MLTKPSAPHLDEATAAQSLLSAEAVRERADRIFAVGLADRLEHLAIDLRRLDDAAVLVAQITLANYPTLAVPLHSRWRHFVANGVDRWAALCETTNWPDLATRARAEFDLAIVSVLLDAGAGPAWRYHDVTGAEWARSEGLAIASLEMFAAGLFSAGGSPLRADAATLAGLNDAELCRGFQSSPGNELLGLQGRASLIRRLGRTVAAASAVFARHDAPRPGGLFDHFADMASGGCLAAATVLAAVLEHLGPVWPSPIVLAGVPMGDCWRHPAAKTDDVTDGLVPFHKLSQWLAYSLIEPLERAGIRVTDLDGLTGLAEYRNGGLLLDSGVLALRDPEAARRSHAIDSTLVVEWRALTVALLDRLAPLVRTRLGCDERQLPLAKMLQGGTWTAGRAIARRLRPDGSPPLRVVSDGTVF